MSDLNHQPWPAMRERAMEYQRKAREAKNSAQAARAWSDATLDSPAIIQALLDRIEALESVLAKAPCEGAAHPDNPRKCKHSTHGVAASWSNCFCAVHEPLKEKGPTNDEQV